MSYTQNPFGAQPGGANNQPKNDQPSGPYGGNPNAAFGMPSKTFTPMNFEAPVVNGRIASKLVKPDANADESSSEESDTDSDSDDSVEEPLPTVQTNGANNQAPFNSMNNTGMAASMQAGMQSAAFEPQQQQQQPKKKGLFSKLPFFKKKGKAVDNNFEQPQAQTGQMSQTNDVNTNSYVPGTLNDVYSTPVPSETQPQEQQREPSEELNSVLSPNPSESAKQTFLSQPHEEAMVSKMSVTPLSPKMTPGSQKNFEFPPGLGLATKKNIAQQQPLQPAGMNSELQGKFQKFNLGDAKPVKKPDLPPRVEKKQSVDISSKPRKNSKYNTKDVTDLLKPSTESVNLGVNALFNAKGSSQSLKLAAKSSPGDFDSKLKEKSAKAEAVKMKLETIQAKSQPAEPKKQSLKMEALPETTTTTTMKTSLRTEKKDKKKKKKKKKRKKDGDRRKRKKDKERDGKAMSYRRKGSSSLKPSTSGTVRQRKGSSSSRKNSHRPSRQESFQIPTYRVKPSKSTNAQSLEKVDAMIKGMEDSIASPETDASKKEQLKNMVQKLKQKRTNLQLSAGLELLEELE